MPFSRDYFNYRPSQYSFLYLSNNDDSPVSIPDIMSILLPQATLSLDIIIFMTIYTTLSKTVSMRQQPNRQKPVLKLHPPLFHNNFH